MSEFKLKAALATGKPNKTRQDGSIPAVVYGKHFENKSIAIDKKEFDKTFKEAGTSNLIDMTVGEEKFKTLVHDIQIHPITGDIIHIDFLKINMKEKIHAEIPLSFIGESAAVINMEGSLINPIDSIEVECLPADLPSEIEVDLSALDDFEKTIKVADLKIPAGVEVLSDPEELIASVQAPRSDEELAELETAVEENVEAVEVDHKGEETPAEGEAAEEKKEE